MNMHQMTLEVPKCIEPLLAAAFHWTDVRPLVFVRLHMFCDHHIIYGPTPMQAWKDLPLRCAFLVKTAPQEGMGQTTFARLVRRLLAPRIRPSVDTVGRLI